MSSLPPEPLHVSPVCALAQVWGGQPQLPPLPFPPAPSPNRNSRFPGAILPRHRQNPPAATHSFVLVHSSFPSSLRLQRLLGPIAHPIQFVPDVKIDPQV